MTVTCASQGRASALYTPSLSSRPARSPASEAARPPSSSKVSIPTLRVSRYRATRSDGRRRCGRGSLPQSAADRRDLGRGPRAEKGEGDVQVLRWNESESSVRQLPLPGDEPLDRVVGKP